MLCVPFIKARFFNLNESRVEPILSAEARGQ